MLSTSAGRFTFMRSIILRLGHNRKPYVPFTGGSRPPNRKALWIGWKDSLFNEEKPRVSFLNLGGRSAFFPSLERVVLDFTDWQLSEADALHVSRKIPP